MSPRKTHQSRKTSEPHNVATDVSGSEVPEEPMLDVKTVAHS